MLLAKLPRSLFALMLLVSYTLQGQTKTDTLTNAKIITLSKLNLPPAVIIEKINSSKCVFDVSTDGLINLSSNGVGGDVINEMMKANTKTNTETANKKDMKDPRTKRSTGIYFYNAKDTSKLFRKVDPTVVSTSKTGGLGNAMARYYSGGLAKAKMKSSLAGANSKLQIAETNPVFYFYFDNASNANVENWFFASATSPNEFVLAKLDKESDSREMVVATANAYGTNTGISNKIKVAFEYEEIGEGIYKVIFKQPLEKGEYCFLYASSTPSSRWNNDKVFDFGISVGK